MLKKLIHKIQDKRADYLESELQEAYKTIETYSKARIEEETRRKEAEAELAKLKRDRDR